MKNGSEQMKAFMTRPVYLENSFDEQVIRTEPSETWLAIKWFAKEKGGKEFPADPTAKNVFNAMLEWKEINQADYEKY